MDARKTLIAWLNDAYAMENMLVPVLENHAKDEADFDARARIKRHVEETRHQADRLRACLDRLSNGPSTVKSVIGKFLGAIHAPGTGIYDDELVKNGLMDYATEQFEIACYEALLIAATECGEADVITACEQNLREEEAMAEWLRERLPTTVRNYLGKKDAALVR